MANEAKYVVELTSEERSLIKQMLSKGKAAAYKQRHGRILLLTDQGPHSGKKMSDVAIAQALACGQATVERIRKRFVLEGFEVALSRKNRTNYQRKRECSVLKRQAKRQSLLSAIIAVGNRQIRLQ